MGLRVIFTKWAWAYDGDRAQSPIIIIIMLVWAWWRWSPKLFNVRHGLGLMDLGL